MIFHIYSDLNNLETRPPMKRIQIEKPNGSIAKYNVNLLTDLGDIVQATGPRYQMKDIKCIPAVNLGKITSGVFRK